MLSSSSPERLKPPNALQQVGEGIKLMGKGSGKLVEYAPVFGVMVGEDIYEAINAFRVGTGDWKGLIASGEYTVGALAAVAIDRLFIQKNPQFKARYEQWLGRVEFGAAMSILGKFVFEAAQNQTDWFKLMPLLWFADEGLALALRKQHKSLATVTFLREGLAAIGTTAALTWAVPAEIDRGDKVGAALLAIGAVANFGEAMVNAPRFDTLYPIMIIDGMDGYGDFLATQLEASHRKMREVFHAAKSAISAENRLDSEQVNYYYLLRRVTEWHKLVDVLNNLRGDDNQVVRIEQVENTITEMMPKLQIDGDTKAAFADQTKKIFKRAKFWAGVFTFGRELKEKINTHLPPGPTRQERQKGQSTKYHPSPPVKSDVLPQRRSVAGVDKRNTTEPNLTLAGMIKNKADLGKWLDALEKYYGSAWRRNLPEVKTIIIEEHKGDEEKALKHFIQAVG